MPSSNVTNAADRSEQFAFWRYGVAVTNRSSSTTTMRVEGSNAPHRPGVAAAGLRDTVLRVKMRTAARGRHAIPKLYLFFTFSLPIFFFTTVKLSKNKRGGPKVQVAPLCAALTPRSARSSTLGVAAPLWVSGPNWHSLTLPAVTSDYL